MRQGRLLHPTARMRAMTEARAARPEAKGRDQLPGPVLMFDSGIGGLTVLREARVLMPNRRFVYIADDAAFPYGAWEEPALRERILALFDDLRSEERRVGKGCRA